MTSAICKREGCGHRRELHHLHGACWHVMDEREAPVFDCFCDGFLVEAA